MTKVLGWIRNKEKNNEEPYFEEDENGYRTRMLKVNPISDEISFKDEWVSNSMWEKVEKQTYESVDQEIGAQIDEDLVNHPPHYTKASVETIDIIKAMTENLTGIEAVCVGNIVKYTHRFKYKNGIEDLKKARWYLNKLIGDEQ